MTSPASASPRPDPPASSRRRSYKTGLEARLAAQKIAFAPIMFQAARTLRDSGILAEILDSRLGLTVDELVERTGVSRYGVRVLTEAGLGMDLLKLRDDGRLALTKTGLVLLSDELTRANMDFAHDVCYQGMVHLDEAIKEGRPAGLQVFGDWDTIYEGLASLPEQVQRSWFAFDHHYSDGAFPDALPLVFDPPPARLLDVGGNTGRWARHCLEHDPDVQVTIADLPGQLRMAEQANAHLPDAERVSYHAIDLLDPSQVFPAGFDVVWMSQLVCCFSEEQMVSILSRARDALNEGGSVYILDTCWDLQEHELASYCLQATSLYFTVFANGDSRMYRSDDIAACIARAGLRVEERWDTVHRFHTLFRCKV